MQQLVLSLFPILFIAACASHRAAQPRIVNSSRATGAQVVAQEAREVNREVSDGRSDLILALLAEENPGAIPGFIEREKRRIDAKAIGNPTLRASLRIDFIEDLLKNAPVFGLAEFEQFELDQSGAEAHELLNMRAIAASAYMGQHRAGPACRLVRMCIETVPTSDPDALSAFLWLGCQIETPEKRLQYEQQGRELIERTDRDLRKLVMLYIAAGDMDSIRTLVEAPAVGTGSKEQGLAILLGVGKLLDHSLLTREQACPLVEKGLRLLKPNASASELNVAASIVERACPASALEAATEAEHRVAPDDKGLLYIARLARAKALVANGRTEDLADYREVDLQQKIRAGVRWAWPEWPFDAYVEIASEPETVREVKSF